MRSAADDTAKFALQAQDSGLNDALAQRFPLTSEVNEACQRGFQHVEWIIQRANDSDQLRSDFETQDVATLIWAMSQVIRESAEAPHVWRRCLAFFLDELRADAARAITAPPLYQGQLIDIVHGASAGEADSVSTDEPT